MIVKKEMCCGCAACVAKCPKACITLKEDSFGFLYPEKGDNCCNCNQCLSVCPIIKKGKCDITADVPISAFYCCNKDENKRKEGSSGGVFRSLSEFVLDNNGAVCGASFSEDYTFVQHIIIKDRKDIISLVGTKYIQSRLDDMYYKIISILNEGVLVLFVGTPCQVAALKSFLGKSYDNLILVDMICHGVPSSGFWERYLSYRKQKANDETIDRVSFRDKTIDWIHYQVKIDFGNGKQYKCLHNRDPYMKAFLSNYSLRDVCYNCGFKKSTRESDLTIADGWGIERIDPTFDNRNGVSTLLVNTIKGEKVLSSIQQDLTIRPARIEDIKKHNSSLDTSPCVPDDRDAFIKDYQQNDFEYIIKKYFSEKKSVIIKNIVKSIIR